MIGFERSAIDGFEFEDDKDLLSKADILKLKDVLKNVGITFGDLLKMAKSDGFHNAINGNSVVHLVGTQVAGNWTFKYNAVPLSNFALVDDETKGVISSDLLGLKKDDANVVPIYPQFKQGRRTIETIFHFRNEIGISNYFGMPDITIVRPQFIEYSLMKLSEFTTGKGITASHILIPTIEETITAGESDDDFDASILKMSRDFKRIATAEGDDPQTALFMSNPGNVPVQHIKLDFNQDSEWWKTQADAQSSIIFASHGDNKQLSGRVDASSSLGNSALILLYQKYQEVTIAEHQERISGRIGHVINFIMDTIGNENFKDIKPVYKNHVQSIIEKLAI